MHDCIIIGGDTKAYKETAQWKIETNKKVIMKMRQQSKEYRTQLAKSKAVSKTKQTLPAHRTMILDAAIKL